MAGTYLDAVDAIKDYYGSAGAGGDIWQKIYKGQKLTPTEISSLKQVPGINYSVTNSGRVSALSYDNPFAAAGSAAAAVDSNVPNAMYPSTSAATSGKFRVPADYSIDTLTQNYKIDSGARKVSGGARVASVAGKVATAVTMVSAATWLGKTIDETLYNAGNYFNLNPPESLNPQTWDSLVSDFGPGTQAAFDALFGIDGDATTMYLPEDALGYAYQYWLAQGAWNTGGIEIDPTKIDTSKLNYPTYNWNNVQYIYSGASVFKTIASWDPTRYYEWSITPGSGYCVPNITEDQLTFVSDAPITLTRTYYQGGPQDTRTFTSNQVIAKDGSIFYMVQDVFNKFTSGIYDFSLNDPTGSVSTSNFYGDMGWVMYNATQTTGGIEGVSDDPEAGSHVNPTLIDASTPQTVLRDLRQNYPQIFDGEITRGLPDAQTGDVTERRYIPVPFPNMENPSEPATGDSHQSNPEVDPETSSEADTETIDDIMTGPETPTPEPPSTPDPPDKGKGDTPTVVPATGSASSLWAIYNPTQAEVDSFGAWLWSSNLVDQIKKLFSDPMQAIIGIHKVFATPSTGAAQNIKVGYLDSGVPSAVVTNQYTTVNCGTVDLREYFGNVLDYSPFTEVSLYLPFVGIVKLDTADVMRASISVIYHVDVLTGACLADVKVIRDASGGVLYQYAGSAIVTYPISSGSYVGAVAGVLGIAGGIAGTVLSGGALAPALLGGAMGATHLHADVKHSGGFSGAAGAMGGKKPYLIISRAQGATPVLTDIKGTPATKRVTLGSCSGYTVIDQVNLDGIPATSGELSEIETLLKQGVIV